MADVGDESSEYRAIVMRTFASEDERYQFYNKYALEKGFSARISYVEWDGANKKIVSTLAAYLNALTEEGVHVSDSMMMNASFVYPDNTPTRPQPKKPTIKGQYSRNSIPSSRSYNQHLLNAARLTVPGGPSVACSTAKAVEWDAAWSKLLDPSGRAALGIHDAAYDDTPEKAPASSVDLITENVFRPAHGESLVPAAAV